MISRPNARPLAALLVLVSSLLAGCGEQQMSFTDPNALPPINADAAAAVKDQDRAVAEAERAVGAANAKAGRSR